MKIDNIEELLVWANKTYYPFNWVIEGPYLFINNYQLQADKENGLAYFPSIASIKNKKEFIFEAIKWIRTHSEFLLKNPKERGIEFNNEEHLTIARILYNKETLSIYDTEKN